MFNQIIFEDEITLYWDKQEFSENAVAYKVYVNGEEHGVTSKTHYTCAGLTPATWYTVRVETLEQGGYVCKKEVRLQTGNEKRKIDVTAPPYCALGDGKTLNTQAIQKAIDDCGENDCVYIPEGTFLTGALQLHGDMELFVAEGATLQGTANVEDYLPKQNSRFEGVEGECYRSLLNLGELNCKGGCTVQNVVIRGKGRILGGGKELLIATMDEAGVPFRPDVGPLNDLEARAWRSRGRLLEVRNAENVVLAGLTVGMSSSWNLHFIYSRNIVTFGCKIVSKNINNGDGWDPDSSENCVIFDTVFDTGDDCIAIKSGKNPEGNIINRPCKNIYIFDCISRGGHGMSVGSEISGGVEGVYIWDCDFDNTWYGIQVKGTRKRGGYVKNVCVSDCRATCILIWSIAYNDDGEGAKEPPVFCDFIFKNVTLTGTGYFKRIGGSPCRRFVCLRGFEEEKFYIRNVKFDGVTLVNAENSPCPEKEFVKELKWENVRFAKEKGE